MSAWGYRIRWHDVNGDWVEVSSSGHPSERKDRLVTLAAARKAGWTKPRWWQWWRRHDVTHRQALGLNQGIGIGDSRWVVRFAVAFVLFVAWQIAGQPGR